LKGGFTINQIKEMGAIKTCQFPNCITTSKDKSLHSDHFHDGHKINTDNYRGEICAGHNILLGWLDNHHEDASSKAQEYMDRRPFGVNNDKV
jgi:hypothetical protein